jgi:hypothetical protein
LIDTNVISEARKKRKANPGVIESLEHAAGQNEATYRSAVTVGKLRRGVVLIRKRGDMQQAGLL